MCVEGWVCVCVCVCVDIDSTALAGLIPCRVEPGERRPSSFISVTVIVAVGLFA